MITLAIIAKYNAESYQVLIDCALPHMKQIIVAVDDGAEPGIDRYQIEYVDYYHRPLANNFAAQRNFLCDHATQPWILHLDTDENLRPWMWEHIETLCAATAENVILLPRANRFVGDYDNLVGWPDWQPKLHRSFVRWEHAVHEWPIGYRSVKHSSVRFLPEEDQYAIQHTKTQQMQDRSNKLYTTILTSYDKTVPV